MKDEKLSKALELLANYYGEQAKYHKKQANKWLFLIILSLVAIMVIFLLPI